MESSNITAALSASGGVALGWLLGMFQERRRWKREDLVRFHDYRRGFYLRFLQETTAAARLFSKQDFEQPEQVVESLERLYSELELIGSRTLLQHGANLLDAILSLAGRFDWLHGASGGSAGRGRADKAEIEILRHKFLQAGRKELGLPTANARRIE